MREAWTTGPWDGHKAFTVKGICVIRPPLLMACDNHHTRITLAVYSSKEASHIHVGNYTLHNPCKQIAATCRVGKTNSPETQSCEQGNYASSQLKYKCKQTG